MLEQYLTLATMGDLTTMARFTHEVKVAKPVLSWPVLALGRQVARLRQDHMLDMAVKAQSRRRVIEDNHQEVLAHVVLDCVTPDDMSLPGFIGHYAAEQYAWQEIGTHDLEKLNAAVVRMHDIPSDPSSKDHAEAAAITTHLFTLRWHYLKYGELQRSRRDKTTAQLSELARQAFLLNYCVLFEGMSLGSA